MIDKRFDEFLRRGGETPRFESVPAERKFNPYYDPDDGRFTFAPGRGTLAPRVRTGESAGMMNRVQNPPVGPGRPRISPPPTTPPAKVTDHGGLSAQYESTEGGNPGEVSTGEGDSGGVSYGTHQLSSRMGTVAAFLSSPEGGRWSSEFTRLAPGSSAFSDKWRQVAAREPRAFGAAQKSYVDRTHYDAAARSIARRSGLDIERRSEALRQVTYSTAVQHGPNGGPAAVALAVSRTDKQMQRSDPRCEAELIKNVYQVRVEHFLRKSQEFLRVKNFKKAKIYRGIATDRLPAERAQALQLLAQGK